MKRKKVTEAFCLKSMDLNVKIANKSLMVDRQSYNEAKSKVSTKEKSARSPKTFL